MNDPRATLGQYFARNRDRYRESMVDLVSRLVARPTVNAGLARMEDCPGQEVPGEETRVVDVLRPELEAMGVPCQVHAAHPRRANLLASIGAPGKVMAVGCHSDIVPPGDGWDTDPYQVVLKDGFLYGRGVLDNKGPMAASLLAMRLLLESGVSLAGTFQLAAIASEEYREPGQQDPGIEFLLEQGVLKPDFAIIPDIGENMRSIDIAEKGRTEVFITAIGRQAHGSTPERGVNAVYQMARLVALIEGLDLPHQVHPVLGSPTINLGIIRGGAASNIVPGECRAILDVRFVPGQSGPQISETIRDLASRVGGEWRIELGPTSQPHAIDAQHPLVSAIQRNASELLGFVPEPFGMGGGTFAKTFNLGGIPAVGYGPGADDAFHVANESVELEQLVDFVQLLACVSIDLLGTR